jgi:hypothetical protein
MRAVSSEGTVFWLYAGIEGRYYSTVWLHDQFYNCDKEMGERPVWAFGDPHEKPTWFKSLGGARRRLRTSAVKDEIKHGALIEIVRVRLIAHEDVAYTSAEDAVSKLGALTGKDL